jgi:uncharacterized membrane protein
MKKILLILTLIFLNSCRDPNSYPKIVDQEQLTPIFELIIVDGVEYINPRESYCLSRVYRIGKGYLGPISEAIKLNIKECDRVIGYAPSEYNVFATWLENFRHWLLGFNKRK